jgi:hypothetical protein
MMRPVSLKIGASDFRPCGESSPILDRLLASVRDADASDRDLMFVSLT